MAATAAAGQTAQDTFARGVAEHLAGRPDAAAPLYRQALDADPSLAEAANNLGTIVAQLGDTAEAESLFQRAVAAQPDYGEAHNNLGILWSTHGDHARALPAFERAVALDPTRPQWLNNLGNAYVEHFRFTEALDAYDRVLALTPHDAECWSNRALALRGLRRHDDAVASLEESLRLAPSHVNALSNLGIILKEQKRFDAAIAAFERATAIDPANAALWANFAAVYEPMGEYERMRALANRAVELDPDYPESYNLLANCELEAGNYDAAEALYQRVVEMEADNRNANWNLALIWLLRGDFARGWPQFEWRKRLQSVLLDHAVYPGEPWSGDPLAGRDILLHSEQGIGDAIQFVRYAPLLKELGAGRVYLECPYPIAPLLAGVAGVDAVIARGTPLPPFSVHANLMSVPALVGTTLETVPAAVPYIPVEPRPVQAAVIAPQGQMKVGIVWAGNPIHARDFLRSAPLSAFDRLIAVPGTAFFSLQKGEGAELELASRGSSRITNLAPWLTDFRDTAAAIAALDLVITVDTSVAHLAGALGKPTWLLLPRVPDFRWMLERDHSPWYPGMRLFRQSAPRDWPGVFAAVERALREHVARPTAGNDDSSDVAHAGEGETPVTLSSAFRTPDGRPRFDLWVPLAALHDPLLFAEYEAELVGHAAGAAARVFLDDVLVAHDRLVDVAPGLGLVALTAATAPELPASISLVAGARDGARIAGMIERRAPGVCVDCTSSLGEALDRGVDGVTRTIVRLGAPADAAAAADAIARRPEAARPAMMIWSSIVPADVAPVLEFLQATGYVHAALSLVDGEVSLDAIADPGAAQTMVSITPAAFEALVARAAASARGASDNPGVAPRGCVAVGIDWELRADTGWGVYGTHLAVQLAGRADFAPAIFAADPSELTPVTRFRLDAPLRDGAARARAIQTATAPVAFDGIMLRALGNNFTHAPHWDRIAASRNVGVIFFEDTAFDREALARAQSLDLVVTGSHWNEEVLRAHGVTNVVTVLQGIDPTVFHPAPSSGQLADRFVVFSGGKLEYRKGQDLVVAAFRIFRERHPEALLMVAWHNNWPALITDLALAGHVQGAPAVGGGHLLVTDWLAANGLPASAVLDIGRVPNALMGQVVREADAALFPNRCEGGTNLVAMECMAAGVPTIVSANSGHLDLVATGGCIPLQRQRAVAPPTQFFRGTDGWGESDIDEMVEALEVAYTSRAVCQDVARRGAAALAATTWRHQVDALCRAIAPLL